MEQNDGVANSTQMTSVSRVLVSGASGLIGLELSECLRSAEVSVTALTRRMGEPNGIHWNPEADELDPSVVSGFDAVIHLAGEPVGSGRWTKRKKRKIYESRVHGTAVLAKALASAAQPPKVFLCASGINYYPSSGSELLDESGPAGNGFLSEVCVGWEQAALLLSPVSRVVSLRIGVVLSEKGGTLLKMLPVFRWGLGGYVGDGKAYMSWITLTDTVQAMLHILGSEKLQGPVNLVSPEPVTGRIFAETLGRRLHRPARLRVPAALLHLVLGELAEETILSSVRAVPAKLIADGFQFQSQALEEALVSFPTL